MSSTTAVEPVDLLLIEDRPSDAELALRALRDLDLGKQTELEEDGAEAVDFIVGRDAHAERSAGDAPSLIPLDLLIREWISKDDLRRYQPTVWRSAILEICDLLPHTENNVYLSTHGSVKRPKVSGHEVLRTLKSDERTKHIPVIVLSSSKEDSDVERCYELGVNSYVVKPVDFGQFTEAVQRIGTYWLDTNERPA